MKILVVQETDWVKRGGNSSITSSHGRLDVIGHEIKVIDFKFDRFKNKN